MTTATSTIASDWLREWHNLSGLNCAQLHLLNVSTNCSIEGEDPFPPPRYWLSILFLFPAVTLFGNLLVVFSVIREKSLQTATNYFIVSLALADISLAILVMPLNIWLEIHNGMWSFPPSFCDAFIMFDVMFCTSSILNLTAISIDRFVAVTQPVKYYRHRNFTRIYITIALTWVISFGIALPIACGINYSHLRTKNSCAFVNADFIICSSIGSFYLPALAMLLIYYRIFRVIWKRAQIKVKMVGKKTSVAPPVKKYAPSDGGCLQQATTLITQANDPVVVVQESASISISEGGDLQMDQTVMLPVRRTPVEDNSFFMSDLDNDSNQRSRPLDVTPLTKKEKDLMNITKTPGANQQFIKVANNNNNNTPISNGGPKNTIHPVEVEDGAVPFETMDEFRQHLKLRIRLAKQERSKIRSLWRPKRTFKLNFKNPLPKLQSRDKSEKSVASKEKKATKTLAIVLGVFLVCWLPYFTINVLYGFSLKYPILDKSPVMDFVNGVYSLFTWFGYVNSFLNPVIYTTFNAEFRRAFSKLLCPKKRRRPY